MKNLILVLLITVVISPIAAQSNIKYKLDRKANDVVDDLLFGKKKKGKGTNTTNNTSSGQASETYKSDDEGSPLGGYVRKPVNYSGLSANKVMHFRELIDFLPDQVGTFSIAEKPDGATMRFGESSYSYGSKNYESVEREMTIVIYDYLFTAAMFGTYANAYEYETTDGMMKSVEVGGHPGWFSTTYESGETQLVLIVNDRFMINISRKGASELEMRTYANTMELNSLPEGIQPEDASDGSEEASDE